MSISKTVAVISLFIVLVPSFLLFVFGMSWLSYQKELSLLREKREAIDSCMKISSSTATFQSDDGKDITSTYPEQYWYALCLREKGIK